MNTVVKEFLQKPASGTALTVASGLFFFFTCMLLPLVGRAGASVSYAGKNQLVFLSALGLTLLLSVLATWTRMLRRSADGSPMPVWSIGLCGVCIVLFILQVTGLLAI